MKISSHWPTQNLFTQYFVILSVYDIRKTGKSLKKIVLENIKKVAGPNYFSILTYPIIGLLCFGFGVTEIRYLVVPHLPHPHFLHSFLYFNSLVISSHLTFYFSAFVRKASSFLRISGISRVSFP